MFPIRHFERDHQPLVRSSGFGRIHRDLTTIAPTLEAYNALAQSEESEVTTKPHALTWVKAGASLTHDDAACTDDLAVVPLQPVVIRV
jgi:hypothetical protein